MEQNKKSLKMLSYVELVVGVVYLAEGLIYGNFIAALASIPTNLIQVIGSAALFVFLGMSLDKTGLKKFI